MIEVSNLVKYYGDFLAVDNISFSIQKGEIIGLLGPNGAGKSTTIRMICGYLTPNQGKISIDGFSIADDPVKVKETIGYLPESAPLYEEMIVFDYLLYVAQLRNIPKSKTSERLKEVAKLCGLFQVMHKNISELSKGYRQRVGLAHALIGDPDVLVLDEPTSGLDPNQILEIRNLIKEVGKTKTVIMCSHILSEVEATCDRVIIINQGKVVADNSTIDLKQNYRGKSIFLELDLSASFASEVIEKMSTINGVSSVTPKNDANFQSLKLVINYENQTDLRREVFQKIVENHWTLLSFHQDEKSLENIFRELTQNHQKTNDHPS